ncbi:MAG: LysE family translocator [Candidatus Baltobacteraceae bacterium]|jgi:threonine/homoserine/homoserine lactone efflux protein
MPDLAHCALFALAAALLVMTPGPGTMYLLARTLAQGRSAGLLSALGSSTGYAVHVSAAALGLSALILASVPAFNALKWLGAAYLIYLGVVTWRQRGGLARAEVKAASAWHIYAQAVATTVFNPKVAVFFIAFIPQFVVVQRSQPALQILVFGAILLALEALWKSFVATVAAAALERLERHPSVLRWQRRISGTILAGLGLQLALIQRR